MRGVDGARGFTLIELLVTLAIASILIMAGAPALGHLLARVSTGGAEASLAASLRHARAAAVMHNTRVLVCPSTDGRHCLPGYDWQYGWIIGPDADADGEIDGDGVPYIVAPPLGQGSRVITSTGRRHVAFHPDGDAAGTNATFTICHAQMRGGQSVVVSSSGRVRTADPDPDRVQQCRAGLP